jgi:hypothetical protein
MSKIARKILVGTPPVRFPSQLLQQKSFSNPRTVPKLSGPVAGECGKGWELPLLPMRHLLHRDGKLVHASDVAFAHGHFWNRVRDRRVAALRAEWQVTFLTLLGAWRSQEFRRLPKAW